MKRIQRTFRCCYRNCSRRVKLGQGMYCREHGKEVDARSAKPSGKAKEQREQGEEKT